jgi:hypothetical protein
MPVAAVCFSGTADETLCLVARDAESLCMQRVCWVIMPVMDCGEQQVPAWGVDCVLDPLQDVIGLKPTCKPR